MDEYLNEATVAEYVKAKGLYPPDAKLTVHDLHDVKESVDGYVNLIFTISDGNGRDMVLKQTMHTPRSRSEGSDQVKNPDALADWTLDTSRMRNEIAVLIFWNAIDPGICPAIYHFDEVQGIEVMESLIDHSLLRFDHCRMTMHPEFPAAIGRFFARNLYYASDLHLTHYKKLELEKFFDNPEYTGLDFFLFEDSAIVSDNRLMPEATWPLRQQILEDAELQRVIVQLRHQFLHDKECLIHTDLHASNIMVKGKSTKIIDTEFAGFGPLAQDMGRLLASFVLNFFSWYGDRAPAQADKAAFQQYLLDSIEGIYSHFATEFARLAAEGQQDSYRLKRLNVDAFIHEHFVDSLRFLALNAGSRIANRGLCHDFERLEAADRVYPIQLTLVMLRDLLKKTETFTSPKAFTAYLKGLALLYPENSL